MSFTNPNALWLLLLVPVFVVIGWPRLAYRRLRDTLSLLIRITIVVLLVLGLAGAQLERAANRLAGVFLIDVSDSGAREQQGAALDDVRRAAEAMGPDDRAAVGGLGGDGQVGMPEPVR